MTTLNLLEYQPWIQFQHNKVIVFSTAGLRSKEISSGRSVVKRGKIGERKKKAF
jgi:hypothetical protein